jgi:hypothetical protein
MPYPPKKNPKLIEEVLSRIAKGETLASLARELDFHPMTWQKWLREDEGLSLAYAEAREVGHDALADQTLEIADSTKAISEHVQLSKLRIETRMKLLASWAPKKYGPKSTVDVGNKDGETLKVDSNIDTAALTLQLAEALRKKDADA